MILQHKALVSDGNGAVFWVPVRDLKPLAEVKSAAPVANDVKAVVPAASDVKSAAPAVRGVIPPPPPPGPEDWVVYKSLSKAHIAQVVQDQKHNQTLIASGQVKKGKWCYDWVSNETGLITNSLKPPAGKSAKAEYVIEAKTILGRWPASEKVPQDAMIMLADFKRDPAKFKT